MARLGPWSRLRSQRARRVRNTIAAALLPHGPVKNVDLPGMTMVFVVRDPALLAKVQVSNKVRFVAEKTDAALVVTALELVQ